MNVLFIHQNFPGQFKALAPAIAALPGTRVEALAMREVPPTYPVQTHVHTLTRGSTPGLLSSVSDFESKVLRATSAAEKAEEMRLAGFTPDVIVAHPGWGETLFLREVWPDAKQLHFLEFFYHTRGVDTDFDPNASLTSLQQRTRVLSKRAAPLWAMSEMDWGLSPTEWQKHTYPEREWDRISVIHDGIDTDFVKPAANAQLTLQAQGIALRPGDPIITFVNRNLEPYRGYHIFMRALPEILAKHPTARVLIVGGDGVSYGAAPLPGEPSWKQRYLSEVADRLDMSRVHFLGNISYPHFLGLLQISAVHVYLTFPFVLSWSLLEAMATECLIVGSRTAPVMEVVEHEKNGLLVDFFDVDGLARTVLDGLNQPEKYRPLRQAARQAILERYDLKSICLPAQVRLIQSIHAGNPRLVP